LHYAWFAALPFLAAHASVQIRRIMLEESWLDEFGQSDKWSFCLIAAKMAAAQERR
jgi:hypothetical protein